MRGREDPGPSARPDGAELPDDPRYPGGQTHDYRRNGTTNLYAALNAASGNVITTMTARHRAIEFIKFLNIIGAQFPDHLDVHLVIDNVSTHKTEAVQLGLSATRASRSTSRPPTRVGSKLVERWFPELANKWLRRNTHRSVRALTDGIRTWVGDSNDNPRPFGWHKTADQILDSLPATADGSATQVTSPP